MFCWNIFITALNITVMRIYIKTLLISLGFSVVTITIHSQSLPDSTSKKIDSLFKKWDNNNSPGCALGIIKDGRLIYKRGYGMANLDYNIPISPKSVFDIQSITKQFTAMSILLIAKQGKLSLDEDIQKYLTELPRYQSPITIRHLIHHTGGIRNVSELVALAGMRGENVYLTAFDDLGLIARQKELNFKPGEEYLYSNEGYFLLGLIVERVSGKSLREFIDENIFKPLGMINTHLPDDRTLVIKNRATGYVPSSNGGFSATIDSDGESGCSGLHSSVEDLFLWDQNFYNNKLGGGPDLISEALSIGMLNNGEKIGYAFGLGVGEYKGLKSIGHGGSGPGFRAYMSRFPEQNFSVICLCNADNISPYGLTTQVADIFLADQYKKGAGGIDETVADVPDIISIPEKELARLTGLYFDPITETTIRFHMKDGKLIVDKGPGYVLSPLSRNRFTAAEATHEIVFVRPIAGGPMQVKDKDIRSGRTKTYEAVQSVTLTSVQLAEFTGKYLSDELGGATYTLSMKDGKLILQVRYRITVFSDSELVSAFAQELGSEAPKDILLTPVFADAFITFVSDEVMVVRFMRNQQNAVSGFTLSTETVRRLRFNKL
jgi:CubicO group peptidase (beta-lactamase class C family)